MSKFLYPRGGKKKPRHESVEPLEVRRLLSGAISGVVASPAAAGDDYSATVLYALPGDAYSFKQAFGGQVVGFAYDLTTFSPTDAALWTTSGDIVDLNTASDSEAEAWATDGTQQVGWGGSSTVEDAMLWSGSSGTAVNLNPSGFSNSIATSVSGSQEVGYGTNSDSADNALLWTGSASSVVNLNPSGFSSSAINATDGSQQVGFGSSDGVTHLLLWSGSASSYVELDPAGYVNGSLLGVASGQQVGDAFLNSNPANPHALLWTGSAGSVVDLNPQGLDGSIAYDTNGVYQVGAGIQGSSSFAYVWSGTAGSAINLNSLLPAGGGWFYSLAYSVDKSGNIYGIATGSNGTYAVEWSPPPPAKLAFQTIAGATAGSTLGPVSVDVEFASGDTDPFDNAAITVAIESGPTGATLSGTKTENAVNGIATFSSLSLTVAGKYTLTASDSADGLSGFTSNSFTITAAAASKLVYAQQPGTTTAGSAISPAVSLDVEDKYGNIVTTDTSTVTIAPASEPSGGVLTGTTSAAAKSGVATLNNLILDTSGSYTLKATDGSLTSATSSSFTVNAATATQLVLAKALGTATAGAAISPAMTLDIEDKFGNLATSNTSTVSITIASGPSGAKLTGTTSAAAKSGVATLSNLILDTTGAYMLTASDGSLTSVTTASFNVNPAAANKLVITQGPTPVTAGITIGPAMTVDVDDAFGNLVTTNSSTITVGIASGPSGAKVSGSASAAASGGVAMLGGVILDTAGNYTLKFSDGSLTSATSSSFAVSPAAASKLAFVQQPSGAAPGVAISPAVTVAVEDQFGNVITSDSSTINMALASGPSGAALTGTTSAGASSGIASFSNLILATAGTGYTLRATDGSLASATSNSFSISAPNASISGTISAGGVGVANVTVYLDNNNDKTLDDGELSTVTNSSGAYSFTGLTAGTDIVRQILPAGDTQTSPTDNYGIHITLASGQVSTGNNFIDTVPTSAGSISGTVTAGGVGLAGITVYLDNNNDKTLDDGEASTVTSSSGAYSFTGLAAGTYIVRQILPAGDTQTSPTNNYGIHITLASGQSSSSNNFTDTVPASGGSISGTIEVGSTGLAGVTVYLDTNNDKMLDDGELSMVTSASGTYSFSGLAAGTYIVRQILPSGVQQVTPTNNYGNHETISSNQSLTGVNFSDKQIAGSISGEIFDDTNGNGKLDSGETGLSDWELYIDLNNSGAFVSGDPTTMTDSNGDYTFSDLAAGTYIIRVIRLSGWSQTLPTSNFGQHITIGTGQSVTGVLFGMDE